MTELIAPIFALLGGVLASLRAWELFASWVNS